jgi:hypothetical protein
VTDGRLLVVGGYRGNGGNDTAELRDAARGVFAMTGNLIDERYFHTATLLEDGRVLVVGGRGNTHSALSSAELWDVGSETFSATGPLGEARMFHTATLLADGRVLVVGGMSSETDAPVAEAELWDPGTGTFGPAGTLIHPRAWHTATGLPDGRVLVAGGPAEAELWDPATETFNAAGMLGEARWWTTASLLDDGRVLVVGGMAGEGFVDNAVAVGSAELWDPDRQSFGPAGRLIQARGIHTATLLPDGRVLVVGGASDAIGGPPKPLVSAELWDRTTDAFGSAASLAEARAGHTATLLDDGRVVVVGGADRFDMGIGTTELWTR